MPASSFDDNEITPPSFGGLLQREHLLARLNATPRKLCLIQAPPGYGKTVLLTQIFQQTPTRSLWITVRPLDNDPVRLLHKLSTGLHHLPGAATVRVPEWLDGFAPRSMSPWIHSLIDALNTSDVLQICLNDIDHLSDTGALEVLNLLIRNSAPQVRLYITCTTEPKISYAHLLLEQQVTLLDQSALRFHADDIQALFAQQQAREPSNALLKKLDAISEGWPTAIRFATQQCTDDNSLQALVDDIANGQMAFERYFVERVFDQQPAPLRRLLLRLSLTEDFDTDMCRRFSESEASESAMPDVIRQQWFVTPIDRGGRWFRFHQLFHVFLRKRAQWELTSTEIRATLVAAAHGLHDAGRMEEAIALALQAQDFAVAAHWMETILPTTVIRQGRHQTYLQWFRHLPEQVVSQVPRVRLGHIVALSMGRHFLAAAEQIALLNHYRPHYDEATRRELGRTLDLVFCCSMALQDEAVNVEPMISQWLVQWNDMAHYQNSNDFHYELAFAWFVKGFCAKCTSQFTLAKEALKRAHDHFDAYGSPWGQAWVRSMIALNYARQGFHHEALREALDAYGFAQRHLGDRSHPGYGLAVLIAAIHYETDELTLAEHYQRDALDYLKEQSATDLLIAGYETRARLLMHQGKKEEGLGFLKDGIQWAESQSLHRLKLRLVDELVVWLLRQERANEAERYASHHELLQRGAEDFDMQAAWHHTTARSRVYLMIARGQSNEALSLLAALAERSDRMQHSRRTAEWYKLTAMIHEQCHRADAATQAVSRALTIAAMQNHYRLFLDDETALRPILARVGAQYPGASWAGFLSKLLQKMQPQTPARVTLDALTGKEIEILRYLEKGLSNKEMAALLFVSEGTLKWHLHNIYSKLFVKNRTQALVAARKAGYLQAN